MPRLDAHSVAGHFDQLGWHYRIVDNNTVLTGVRCLVPCYDYRAALEVRTTERWVYLRVLLQRDVLPARRVTVLRFLSRWNQRCHQARLLLVDDCVVVQAEIATVQCHFGAFRDALSAVCRYSELVGVEVSVLATNPAAGELYEAVEAARENDYSPTAGRGLTAEEMDFDFDLVVNPSSSAAVPAPSTAAR
ncbi:hypothetical protein [Streptomyces aurantiogriseus]|uniref:Uncharacterized protein n=1 Tax=Streptomyces aurantiogriseus TaxID=66870 RepID=A0A918CK69_9ACTN|nr:hypothetical protein [Streptomyces aurantiogriseus]GGR25724.1 hypothetical protein GCM10010251_47200 [Streptomyces aurantiogriseus]